jgi:hypothetical protein
LLNFYKQSRGGPSTGLRLFSSVTNADNMVRILDKYDKTSTGDLSEDDWANLARSLLTETGGFVGCENLNTFRYESDQILLMTLCKGIPQENSKNILESEHQVDLVIHELPGPLKCLFELQNYISSSEIVKREKISCEPMEASNHGFVWPEKESEILALSENRSMLASECFNILAKRQQLIIQLKYLLSAKTADEADDDAISLQSNQHTNDNQPKMENQPGGQDQKEKDRKSEDVISTSCTCSGEHGGEEFEKLRPLLEEAVQWWMSCKCDWLWYLCSFFAFHFHIKIFSFPKPGQFTSHL